MTSKTRLMGYGGLLPHPQSVLCSVGQGGVEAEGKADSFRGAYSTHGSQHAFWNEFLAQWYIIAIETHGHVPCAEEPAAHTKRQHSLWICTCEPVQTQAKDGLPWQSDERRAPKACHAWIFDLQITKTLKEPTLCLQFCLLVRSSGLWRLQQPAEQYGRQHACLILTSGMCFTHHQVSGMISCSLADHESFRLTSLSQRDETQGPYC